MWQRRNAESVRNFVIFLLILQNCGQARTQQEERRDGLAKLEFSGIVDGQQQRESKLNPKLEPKLKQDQEQKQQQKPEQEQEQEQEEEQEALYVFNFAKIYETLYTRLLQAVANGGSSTSISSSSRSGINNEQPWQESENSKGRGLGPLHRPQLLWHTPVNPILRPPIRQFVLITTKKPFHILEQLQHDFHEKLKRTTTVKPFSVLQQLDLQQQAQALLLQAKANSSFNIMQTLQMDEKAHDRQTTTVKPFHVLAQLNHDQIEAGKSTTTIKPFHLINTLKQEAAHQHLTELIGQQQPTVDKEEEGFEILQPEAAAVATSAAEPQAQHKSDVPKEQTRAKESQKRKRKRIRRRRKRIRRRRKRTRRRRRKKRKKKRKKRKKKKYKGQKDKKKRKKRKKKKPIEVAPVLGQPGQVIFANPTKHPHYYPHSHTYPHTQSYPYPMPMPMPMPMPTDLMATTTTKRPKTTTTLQPFNKIKYILRHNSIFKKKKKEYLSHVGHVLYPFIKFVAFFTVLNPFTLGVFLFTLISPVVFGFLGFVALSVLVKPFLHLIFGVKRNVDYIDRKQWLANRQAEKLKLALRPVTIHKHYYQKPSHSLPPLKLRPVSNWRREIAKPGPGPRLTPPPYTLQHNPLLPDQRKVLEDDDFEDYDNGHNWPSKML